MNDFLLTSLTFPTLVFSILLGFCVVYWVLAAFGLFDVTDGWSVDADVGDFVDVDPSPAAHGVGAILAKLGLTGVPFMVMLTILSFASWIGSYFVQLLLLSHFPDGIRWAVGLGLTLVALLAGIVVTAIVIRPLRWAIVRFGPEPPPPVLGRVGEVITPFLDAQGGRVSVDDGGAGLIFQARTSSGVTYPRGAKVVLLSVDSNHVYDVVSQSEFDRQ